MYSCTHTTAYTHPITNMHAHHAVVEMRGGQGGLNPPKCARKWANFRNLKANVQILNRKTPQMVYPISPTVCTQLHVHTIMCTF